MAEAASDTRKAWIARVLGVRLGSGAPTSAHGADPATLAAASKLAAMRRPTQPPATSSTDALLGTARSIRLPEQDIALPNALVAQASRFMTAILNEPAMDTRPLEVGATVPAQDQMLGLSDRLDAVGSAMQRWEDLLEQAEAANAKLAPADAPADLNAADDVADAIIDYNALRAAAAREAAQVQELAATLRAQCDGLIGTASKGA